MKKLLLSAVPALIGLASLAQPAQTELYDLVKKLLTDSTGYENVGDWGVGKPKIFPVKWKADRIEMSEDTSINFYRLGTAETAPRGKGTATTKPPVKWNVMLKGPRSGYVSFSLIRSPSAEWHPPYTLDSLFGQRPFTATLLKSCVGKALTGYYYYEVTLPKKDKVFLKLSWFSLNGKTALRIDGYSDWSKYAAKLDCKN